MRPYVIVIMLSVIFICPSVRAGSLKVNEQLIYDETLNVYWTKWAISDKALTWGMANEWIEGLNKSDFGGYNDWRLPDTPDGTWGYNGGNPAKYNVTESELGHLYYQTFELTSIQSGDGYTEKELKKETTPFKNILPVLYWFGLITDMNLMISEAAWVFDFGYGSQFLQTTNMLAYAIAVRSADPVPEPSSCILFLTGLVMLFRFRSNH